MAEVELFDDDTSDLENSKIILQVFPVQGGFLPNWFLEIREEAKMEEFLALRDGIELVRVQFDKMMDIMLADFDEDDE